MRQLILPIMVLNALCWNVSANPTTPDATAEIEELAQPGLQPPVNYHWNKDTLRARAAATTNTTGKASISPLIYGYFVNPPVTLTTVNTYPVFWGSAWANSNYVSDKINGLIYWYSNIAASSYAKVVGEYAHVGHTFKSTYTSTTNVTGSGASTVAAAVCKIVGAANIDSQGYYPVYTGLKRGNATFCAYHSSGTCGGKPFEFAFFFNLDDDQSCDPQSPYAPTAGSVNSQAPGLVGGGSGAYQQSQGLAALINVTAHELAETITDPIYNGKSIGYLDYYQNEVGDKCAWTYGPSNTGLTPGTVLVGSYDWKIQGSWSNKAQTSGVGGYSVQSSQFGATVGCITGS